MAEPVTLVVSVDTEEDNWHPARSGVTADNIAELPRLQRHLERLGLRPTYFTTYHVARDPRASRIIRDLHDSGRTEIGAHLHPWNTPPLDEAFIPRNTMLSNLPRDLQVDKIRVVTTALEACLGVRPYAFRAGRWGFAEATAGALLECGYRVDSSVTPFKSWAAYDEGPSHDGAPLGIYRLDGRGDTRVPVADGRLVEVPLSWGYDRPWRLWGGFNGAVNPAWWRLTVLQLAARLHLVEQIVLSPESESVASMLVLSRRLIELGVRHLHLSWHSPSLVPGLSPFSRSGADVEALYAKVAGYVDGLAGLAAFVPQTVSEVAERQAPPLPPGPPSAITSQAATLEGRRLVVVSYHFPPDPAIGGQRWAGLTKYLRSWRWRSWIVTAAPTAPAAGGVTVVSCPRRRTLNDVWRALRSNPRGLQAEAPTAASASPGGGRPVSWWARLRLDAAILLAFPDHGRGWVLRAAWCTRRMLVQLKPDVLVSSGPPHSAHLAAWLARLGRHVRWVVDLRDPWAGPIANAWLEHPASRSRFARWLASLLEGLVIRSADTVMCNTLQLAGALRSNYPGTQVEWIPNGVDHAMLPSRSVERLPGLALAYVGTMYGARDLSLLLRAIRALFDAHPAAAADGTRLRVAGHVEPGPAALLEREIATLGLQDHVEMLGLLPRSAALDLLARSGLALVLAQQQEYQVPAKLYEVVGLGIPTVVVAEEGSASGSEAVRLGAWRVDEHDVAGLTSILAGAWRGIDGTPHAKTVRVDYMAIAAEADHVLRGTRARDAEPRTSSHAFELTAHAAPE